ncbi:LysE family translocator [Streptomyces netropsis]|uniref:Threonine/homoserine/homoserine lactone efflux protein n=1 Tax=Streptomyces netropsis TaxID=55404 RepID=A0A7W7PBK8_STRNE|nr:LysE family translocator [Streptomyces netropsis]MBB4884089.1 threonine/homoserine/homoserine lactone efflux protein [Streptomyces netropsis]GGR06176.1 lysine transporter LysE [Streptomyces netropsis]
MTISTALWSFALVVGLLTLTPGLDTALVLRTAALGRRRRAWGVVLGIQSGILIWGALTSLGVTALLTASQMAYEILRWAGAAYLLWMGARMLVDTWRGTRAEGAAEKRAVEDAGTLYEGWRQGALTNLLNPKVGVFYVAVLPQFIPAGAPHFTTGLLLTCVHILLGLLWSIALIAFARVLRGWLQRPAARRTLDRVTGTVIAGFGLKLALGD